MDEERTLLPEDLRLSRREMVSVAVIYSTILLIAAVGFALAVIYGRSLALFLGLTLTAFILGVRHGVDADHIAAIDNTTRKLLSQNKKPLTVGTWFSLGHSTVVVGLIVTLIAATEYINSHILGFQAVGSIIGTTISGIFLWLIGLINVIIVLELYRIFKDLRKGKYRGTELEEQLNKRGFMNRFFGRFFRVVDEPWQMYPVGLLFGLGFDTASEVTLIAITLTLGGGSVPLWAILLLPLLFLCGMVLVDTTDGIAMRYAYGWAFLKPIRKIYYNLTVTVMSVLVALLVGTIEFLIVLANELRLGGGFTTTLNNLSFENLGFIIVGLFVGTWLVSMAIYKFKHYEDTSIPTDVEPSTGDLVFAAGGESHSGPED